jgi:hypothetical protein
MLMASELSMLSNGLPPPLPTLPDRCDSAAAGLKVVDDGGDFVDVLDGFFDEEGGATGVFPIMPSEAEGNGRCNDVDDEEKMDVSGTDACKALLVVATIALVVGEVMTMVIVLEKDCGLFVGINPPVPVPVTPVVVVTTATLHNNCIACPSKNNPMILVSSTSSIEHFWFTSALICTSPFKHEFEQVCAAFVKSFTLQPGIFVVYAS